MDFSTKINVKKEQLRFDRLNVTFKLRSKNFSCGYIYTCEKVYDWDTD